MSPSYVGGLSAACPRRPAPSGIRPATTTNENSTRDVVIRSAYDVRSAAAAAPRDFHEEGEDLSPGSMGGTMRTEVMSMSLPSIYLVRHGETTWALTGQHTGRTDIPLTDRGEADGRRLGARLSVHKFARVWSSPALRAWRTCELAGFGAGAERDPDLWEWDYGEYEGLRSEAILAKRPGWQLFRDGCPGGESPAQVAGRADRVIA